MYDLSSKFNAFYTSCVVLPQKDQNELYDKRTLNLQRLKDGFEEYNKECGTSYRIVEDCVQGSVAMSTVVQNEDNDYDIDVAVVFDKSEIENKGAQAIRNVVANALRRKTKQFNAEPEVKTSCVRVKYSDGYHIDFAVYRRELHDGTNYKYEHAGADWAERELKGLTEWFKAQNGEDDKLRKVVRLSKMFCKSRESWKNMPSGLLQTILCAENLQNSYDRIDELFYYTMQKIVNRLEIYTSVAAPVDNGRDLTPRNIDLQKMVNWKNRLKSKLADLDVLLRDDCSREDALQAWYGFFNHDFWNEQQQMSESSNYSLSKVQNSAVKIYSDTEEFIEDLYPMKNQYDLKLDCTVSGDGWRPNIPLKSFSFRLQRFIPHNFRVKCSVVSTNVPRPYKVLWKVKNVGPESQRRDKVRGQIRSDRGNSITENTLFYGNHYIECYIIKDGCCVARQKVDVPIGRG